MTVVYFFLPCQTCAGDCQYVQPIKLGYNRLRIKIFERNFKVETSYGGSVIIIWDTYGYDLAQLVPVEKIRQRLSPEHQRFPGQHYLNMLLDNLARQTGEKS